MRKIALSLAVLGLSTGLTATAALAQTSFADVDTDTNGELSYAELQVAWPNLTQEEFSTADADMSTGLSTTELATLQPAAASSAPASEPVPNVPELAPTDAVPEPAAPAAQ